MNSRPMRNIDKQALRSTSDRDWFEDWFKREFHPDKTGPYIKDQLFFAVRAARAPLLDELETKDKRNAELEDLLEAEIKSWMQRYDSANNRREAAEKRIAELEAKLETADKLQDSSFRHGLQHGFSLGQTDNQAGFEQAIHAYGQQWKGE
ncbi:hypothetical protein ACLEZA_17845 [Enterobacter ludwigii]|uniref:hypothetical protein n=1 Tax=Enterobacter ludwigii TaxID=299767 RepID=UPI003975279F